MTNSNPRRSNGGKIASLPADALATNSLLQPQHEPVCITPQAFGENHLRAVVLRVSQQF
jgi:hypothetical protein